MDELSNKDYTMYAINPKQRVKCLKVPCGVFILRNFLFTFIVTHQNTSCACRRPNKCVDCITFLIKKPFQSQFFGENLPCIHPCLLPSSVSLLWFCWDVAAFLGVLLPPVEWKSGGSVDLWNGDKLQEFIVSKSENLRLRKAGYAYKSFWETQHITNCISSSSSEGRSRKSIHTNKISCDTVSQQTCKNLLEIIKHVIFMSFTLFKGWRLDLSFAWKWSEGS